MSTCLLAFWAALALSILGCDDEPMGPQPPIPLSPPGEPSTTGPRPGPPPAAPRQERPRNFWSRARIGDVLEYEYSHTSAWRTSGQGLGPETSLHATFALEVVAIDSPWVWVKVTVKHAGSSERSFLIPVDGQHEPTPNPTVRKSAGKPSKASVGNTSLACEESRRDESAVDGPVTSWCDSADPLMYLGTSVWWKSSGHGMFGSSHSTLRATRVQRGPEAAAATTPPTGLPKLFAPSLWYRRIPSSTSAFASGQEVQELFVGEWGVRKWRELARIQRTRKDLGRTDLVKVADTWYAPSPWREEPTETLLDTVLDIVHGDARQALVEGDHAKDGNVQLVAGQVESRIVGFGDDRREYAKDPWATLFDGLPWKARSEPLVGSHGSEDHGLRLWDWGTTPLAPTPSGEQDMPDVLSREEILAPVLASVRSSACVRPLAEARKKRHEISSYLLELTLQIKPDGSISSAVLSEPDSSKKRKDRIPPKVLRCLQTDFQTLRFPQHGQQMPPFKTTLGV